MLTFNKCLYDQRRVMITVQEYIIYTFTLYDVTLKVTLKSYRYRESYCKRYRYRYRESYCKRYRYRYHKKLPYMTVNLEVAIEGIIASGKTDRKVFLGKHNYIDKKEH